MLKVWAEEIGLLNRAVGKLESEIHNSLKYNKALICDPEITKYRKQWETLEFEDKKFADSKWKKYQELRKNIDRFKNKFSGKNKLNVEEAQTFASLLERQLTDAKEEATYQVQNFKRELRASEKEAVPLIQKIEQLQKDAEANVTKLKIKEFEKEEKKEKDEEASEQGVIKTKVAEIDNELQTLGGRNLGWLKEDHDDFISLFNKHGRSIRSVDFLQALARNFPLFKDKDIALHIQKLEQSMALENEKKTLMERYKDIQRQLGQEQLISFQKKEAENEEMINRDKNKKFKEHNQQVKKKISEWEVKKEQIYKEKAIEENRIKEKLKKAELERKKKIEEDKIKKHAEILKFREKRQLQAQLKDEESRKKKEAAKKIFSMQDLDRIRQKEVDFVSKRELLIEKKLNPIRQKQDRLQQFHKKVQTKFKAVETRVDQPTTSVAKKQTNKFNPTKDSSKFGNNFAGEIIRTEGRRLVAWRQDN